MYCYWQGIIQLWHANICCWLFLCTVSNHADLSKSLKSLSISISSPTTTTNPVIRLIWIRWWDGQLWRLNKMAEAIDLSSFQSSRFESIIIVKKVKSSRLDERVGRRGQRKIQNKQIPRPFVGWLLWPVCLSGAWRRRHECPKRSSILYIISLSSSHPWHRLLRLTSSVLVA